MNASRFEANRGPSNAVYFLLYCYIKCLLFVHSVRPLVRVVPQSWLMYCTVPGTNVATHWM